MGEKKNWSGGLYDYAQGVCHDMQYEWEQHFDGYRSCCRFPCLIKNLQ